MLRAKEENALSEMRKMDGENAYDKVLSFKHKRIFAPGMLESRR